MPVTMRMEQVLGIKKPTTAMGLIRQIESGLPMSAFERVTQCVAPGDAQLRTKLIPKATLTRRKRSQRLSPSESELVTRLARVWERAVEVYQGDEDLARRFLNQPHPLLDNRSPLDVSLATAAGADLVLEILGRALYGSAL